MKTKYKKNEVLTAVLFLAPSVLLWLFWFLYPALKSMRLSFYDYSFINPERQKFVGLDNYIRLFQDSAFLDALKHTFILAFVVVAFISVLAFIIAVLLEGNIRGKTFFRTVCFMPYIISSVAVSIFFMYFFVKGGLGTRLFMLFGAEDTTWFTNKNYALFFVAIIYIWQQLGFYMILYIGGLQNISEEIYEAAKIDGASRLQSVLHITVPLASVESILHRKCREIPYAENILAINGVGENILSGILAEMGDVSRFDDVKEIQKLSGMGLVSCSSGKHKGQTKISHRGRKRLRYWLF